MQSAVEGLCDIGMAISGYAEIISHNIVKKEVVDSLQTVARQRKITMTIDGGVPEEEKERIFERFYWVDKSHSRETGGTGLGLAIVKHGANLHQALVTVDSKLGEGTCIMVEFR